MKIILSLQAIVFFLIPTLFDQKTSFNNIHFTPINHGTFVIEIEESTVFIDPVGDIKLFETFTKPDIILITDIHGDHLDIELVNKLKTEKTQIIAPKAVFDQLKIGTILNNGDTIKIGNIKVEAIPMYNLSEERANFHQKGRGNGYVISALEKRIYISGDTEDIPEMRQLKDIDFAFVCMNLPYTMTIEQAASAVLDFKPKVVIPFHYRGKGGLSDVEKFAQMVSSNTAIEVKLLKWY